MKAVCSSDILYLQMSTARSMSLNQWIGIRADWLLYDEEPWRHLVAITPADLRTHALVIGATGAGKTNLLHHLIAQDIERGHSFIVLDLRGDLVNAVFELAAGRVQPGHIALIDLREKNRTFGFNPLYGAGEPYFRALSVLDVVASEAESFGVQLAETLRNGLLLLAEVQAPLTKLESLFHDAAFREHCVEASHSDGVIAFWQRFGQLSPDRQAAMAMPVLNKVSLLLSTSTLRRTLGHSEPLDLGQHLSRRGSILLVSLAADELHAAGRMMGSLILSSVCREIFAQVEQSEAARNPVRLYVDEFEHFGSKDFESILAEGRRFGLSVVLAHQTLAQLTPRMRSLILGNVGLKFVFRTGREDALTFGRDIFGSPSAYDFCELPTGYAVLWRRSGQTIEVEINEPLLRRVGALSPVARQLRDQVYAAVPQRLGGHERAFNALPPSVVPPHATPARVSKPQLVPELPRKSKTILEGQPLEDWL